MSGFGKYTGHVRREERRHLPKIRGGKPSKSSRPKLVLNFGPIFSVAGPMHSEDFAENWWIVSFQCNCYGEVDAQTGEYIQLSRCDLDDHGLVTTKRRVSMGDFASVLKSAYAEHLLDALSYSGAWVETK